MTDEDERSMDNFGINGIVVTRKEPGLGGGALSLMLYMAAIESKVAQTRAAVDGKVAQTRAAVEGKVAQTAPRRPD
jgi:hypothetical protein